MPRRTRLKILKLAAFCRTGSRRLDNQLAKSGHLQAADCEEKTEEMGSPAEASRWRAAKVLVRMRSALARELTLPWTFSALAVSAMFLE